MGHNCTRENLGSAVTESVVQVCLICKSVETVLFLHPLDVTLSDAVD